MIGIDPKKFMGFVFVKNAGCCMCSVIRRTSSKEEVGCMWHVVGLSNVERASGLASSLRRSWYIATGYFSWSLLLSATSEKDNSPNNDQHNANPLSFASSEYYVCDCSTMSPQSHIIIIAIDVLVS